MKQASRRIVRSLLYVLLAPIAACSEAATGGIIEEGRQVEVIVATVDGDPIGAQEVRARMERGLDRDAALEACIRERLLAGEAYRRGYGDAADVEEAGRHARVRELLRAIAAEHAPEAIAGQEVRRRFDEVRAEHELPERRVAEHLVVQYPPRATEGQRAQARTVAQAILREVRRGERSLLDVAQDRRRGEFDLRQEQLEPTAAEGSSLAEPFVAALFAAPEPGLLPEVVETPYGAHVVRLQSILEPTTLDFAEHEAEIRAVMADERRSAALADIVEDADERVDEDVADWALAQPLEEGT